MLFLTVLDFPSPTHTVLFLTAEAKTLCLLHSVVLHSRGQEIPSSTQTQCSSSQQRLRHSISDTDTVFFLAVEAKTCLYPDTVLFLTAEADTLCFLHTVLFLTSDKRG